MERVSFNLLLAQQGWLSPALYSIQDMLVYHERSYYFHLTISHFSRIFFFRGTFRLLETLLLCKPLFKDGCDRFTTTPFKPVANQWLTHALLIWKSFDLYCYELHNGFNMSLCKWRITWNYLYNVFQCAKKVLIKKLNNAYFFNGQFRWFLCLTKLE